MKTKSSDLSEVLKKYSNKWLALDESTKKVVSSGQSPKEVLDDARKKGVEHPVLTKAPKDYGTYILSWTSSIENSL